MTSTRCQRATACAGLGVPAGYIPVSHDEGARRVAVCPSCFADAERVGFFCVRFGENEASAERRHDRRVDGLHELALRRRAVAAGGLRLSMQEVYESLVCTEVSR